MQKPTVCVNSFSPQTIPLCVVAFPGFVQKKTGPSHLTGCGNSPARLYLAFSSNLLPRAHPDLSQGPADLRSAALTTELCTHMTSTHGHIAQSSEEKAKHTARLAARSSQILQHAPLPPLHSLPHSLPAYRETIEECERRGLTPCLEHRGFHSVALLRGQSIIRPTMNCVASICV